MRRTLVLSLAAGLLLVLCCGAAFAATPPGHSTATTPPGEARGLKEKVHFPLYDAVTVLPGQSFADAIGAKGGILRFFVDVQNKTKLETNMQAGGVLPHFNTMEVRTLRVTVSGGFEPRTDGTPDLLDEGNLKALNGVLFGSVTSLIVGEKIMIQHPTFYFPSGGGVSAPGGAVATSGEPSTAATFRFEEPVVVEKQQNFRVEIEFPERDQTQRELSTVFGPARVWVTLDGFLTRDVQ